MEVTAPKIIEGDGTEWRTDSSEGFDIVSDAQFKFFREAQLDGKTMENPQVTEGSTHVTLTKGVLAALAEGEHTLAIVSGNGTATARFTVSAPEPEETETQETETQASDTDETEETQVPAANDNSSTGGSGSSRNSSGSSSGTSSQTRTNTSTNTANRSVATGDSTPIAMLMSMLAISGFAATLIMVRRRKKL